MASQRKKTILAAVLTAATGLVLLGQAPLIAIDQPYAGDRNVTGQCVPGSAPLTVYDVSGGTRNYLGKSNSVDQQGFYAVAVNPPLTNRVQAVFADWTPANTAAHDESVEVYSNCDEVELLLNGRSLGSKRLPQDASPRSWTVPFEAGSIRAVGINKGQMAASEELRTAGKPARIVLTTDHPHLGIDWNEVSCVVAQVVDWNGVLVPGATDLMQFKVSGPGVIVAVDNADNASHELFQVLARHAYQGRCVAIIRANGSGRIAVSASADGLTGGSVDIEAARS